MVLFPLKTWNRLINVVLKQNKKKQQKTLVTSKVYFVFIYKWQLFYYQIQKVIKILRRLLKFLMLCNAWLTLVNHLHFKYTHIHIYPYCVYVWVFPLYWKVMTDANASIVCLLLIRNKIFIKISYEICCFACTYLGPSSLADLHQHLPIENVFKASTFSYIIWPS